MPATDISSDITVRKMRFDFPGDFSLEGCDDTFAQNLSLLGISLTMPYLEPFLIDSMREALRSGSAPMAPAVKASLSSGRIRAGPTQRSG